MLAQLATAFATVFLAELPDKTMVATLVLTARYRRPWPVWVGVSVAFLVHVVLAVLLGALLSELPDRPVHAAVGLATTSGCTDPAAPSRGRGTRRAARRRATFGEVMKWTPALRALWRKASGNTPFCGDGF